MTESSIHIEQWDFVKSLGSGTFLWQNRKTKTKAAIKVCKSQITNDSKSIERWTKEIQLMKDKINNEYIVKAITIEENFMNEIQKAQQTNLPILAMEYCDGGNLRQILKEKKNINGLAEIEVRSVLRSLCSAVQYLHSLGIIHRDLKPENIVMITSSKGNIYKLTDLGNAMKFEEIANSNLIANPDYLAPELFLSTAKYSFSLDYFSIGIIAFEIICGVRPFVPHKTIKQYLNIIKKKTNNIIAITERNFENDLKMHKELFFTNNLSTMLKKLIEKWLITCLEIDPKIRGYRKNENLSIKLTKSPLIFNEIFKILDKKILTAFSLNNYKFFSYDINENMNIKDLKNMFALDMGGNYEDIDIILPTYHHINRKKQNITPMDLYIENKRRMIFLINRKTIYNSENSILKFDSIILTDTIKNFLKNFHFGNIHEIKQHYFIEFVRHVLFITVNEELHYNTLLIGIKEYALFLNNQIIDFQNNIKNLCHFRSIAIDRLSSLNEILEIFEQKTTIKQIIKDSLNEDINVIISKSEFFEIQQHIEKLKNLKIYEIYQKILKESCDILENSKIEKQTENLCKLKMENIYCTLTESSTRDSNFCKESLFKVFTSLYEIMEKRQKLSTSQKLIILFKNLSNLEKRFQDMMNSFSETQIALEHIVNKLANANREYNEQILNIIEKCSGNYKHTPETASSNNKNSIDVNLLNTFVSNEQYPTKLLINENKLILKLTDEICKDIDDYL